MAIKNYTSTVDCYKSLGEIQSALAKAGARKIMVEYDTDGHPSGLIFGITGPNDAQTAYQLPANVDGVMEVFCRQKIKADWEQARRTAWRNLRDWTLAQLALIESGMVQTDEVFLPYMTDGRGSTVYKLYQSGQLLLIDGGETRGLPE